MATIAEQTVFHANHAVVKADGTPIGRLQNVQVTVDSGADYVYEVGSIDPVEINHNRRSYRITAQTFVLRRGAHALHRFPSKLGEVQAMTIEFLDRDTGTYWIALGVEPVGETVNLSANQRVAKNVQFMALMVQQKGTGGGSPVQRV